MRYLDISEIILNIFTVSALIKCPSHYCFFQIFPEYRIKNRFTQKSEFPLIILRNYVAENNKYF